MKDSRNLFIILLLLVAGTLGYFLVEMRGKYKQEVAMHIKLEKALTDTVRYHKNERGELVAEKLTMQGDIDDLEGKVAGLNKEKQELISRVRESNKENEVIAAALFSARLTIDSLINSKADIINDSTIVFSDSSKYYQYNILVGNVRPFKNYPPFMRVNDFSIPTDYYVTFNWEKNKREFYPVSFNVSATNPFIKITGIESYAIPELQKQVVKPTGWKKVGNFFKERWKEILIGGAGFAIGVGVGGSL